MAKYAPRGRSALACPAEQRDNSPYEPYPDAVTTRPSSEAAIRSRTPFLASCRGMDIRALFVILPRGGNWNENSQTISDPGDRGPVRRHGFYEFGHRRRGQRCGQDRGWRRRPHARRDRFDPLFCPEPECTAYGAHRQKDCRWRMFV